MNANLAERVGGMLIGMLLAAAAWAQPVSAPEYDRAEVRKDAAFADYLGELREAIAGAPRIEVFEGLPHPVTEKELLARERSSKRVVALHDAEFYAPPQAVAAEQRVELPERLLGTLSEYAGPKRCGAFHADYALRWRDAAGKTWSALFCYGCGEAAVFGPAGSVKCDLDGPEGRAWRQWLGQFDRRRPNPAKQ